VNFRSLTLDELNEVDRSTFDLLGEILEDIA
jgi:hypothetical protein